MTRRRTPRSTGRGHGREALPFGRRARLGAALALALLSGCAHFVNDTSVCPESRDLHCLTPPECSLDDARGCRICQCSPAGFVPPPSPDPLPSEDPDPFQ
jgi:hypothetical protein